MKSLAPATVAPRRAALSTLLPLGLLALVSTAASAQIPAGTEGLPPRTEMVDRIVAVVGDTAILMTEVQQEAIRLQRSGVPVPTDPAGQDSLLRAALDELVNRTLLLERATEAGITVSEDRLDEIVESRFNQMQGRFPSPEAFRRAVEASGMNMFQYRQQLRSEARAEVILSRFRQQLISDGELPGAEVSEAEIREFFEAQAAGRTRPATVTFDRVTIQPEPDSVQIDSVLTEAREALTEIQEGTPFEVAARRYSQDPGSREEGGDLGWIRRADVVPAFAEAAWLAPPGRAVGPIRSRFGLHLIRVQNVRGGERRVQHILFRTIPDEDDVERARELAEALADSLRAGEEPDRLARVYGLRDEEVRVRNVQFEQIRQLLGPDFEEALAAAESGDVVGPLRTEGAFQVPQFVLLKVVERAEGGPYRLEDLRDQIRDNIMQRKQLEAYVDRLRDELYVDLRVR